MKKILTLISLLSLMLLTITAEASTIPKTQKTKAPTKITVNKHYSPTPESLAWELIRKQEQMKRENNKDYRKP